MDIRIPKKQRIRSLAEMNVGGAGNTDRGIQGIFGPFRTTLETGNPLATMF
jgi:hypothetical protein